MRTSGIQEFAPKSKIHERRGLGWKSQCRGHKQVQATVTTAAVSTVTAMLVQRLDVQIFNFAQKGGSCHLD